MSSAPPASRRELAILNQIAEALNRSVDAREALAQTLTLVTELLGLRTGWIWLLDPATDQFYFAGARNLPPYLQEPVRMRGVNCWCLEDFREGKLTPKNIDVMECSRLRPAVQAEATDLTENLCWHASVPLYFGAKPLGIMNLTGPAWRELTADELRLLSTIAYQVGIAVERARLAEDGARLARLEERARIAREIHDTLAQTLTAIALHTEAALNQFDRNPERVRERLERALQTAREGVGEARRAITELHAAPLDGKPLNEALAALARAFTSDTGIPVTCHANGARPLPTRVEAELYRIAQEALNNVRKWAQARAVTLSLEHAADHVRLTVRDDGRGFNRQGRASGGFGLLGMRERARALGGKLRVDSRPGAGTRVVASAPLVDG